VLMSSNKSLWPIAYPNIPLAKHLSNVAKLSLCLFDGKLHVLSRRFKNRISYEWLKEVLSVAAVLHDIGKASTYYKDRIYREGELSFWLHEYVSAIIIYRASRLDNVSPEDSKLLKTVAKVISRHHSAMRGRHPLDLYERLKSDERTSTYLEKVLEYVDRDAIMDVLKENSTYLGRFRGYIEEALESDLTGRMCDFLDQMVFGSKEKVEEDGVPLVASLTGFLIVSDCLVANSEGRESDDGHSPLYVKRWEEELGKSFIDCCREIT